MPATTITQLSHNDAINRYLAELRSMRDGHSGETISVPIIGAPSAVDLTDATRLATQEYDLRGILSQSIVHDQFAEETKQIEENRALKLKEKEEKITIDLTRLFNNGVMQGRYANTFRDERKDTIIVSVSGKILIEISPTHVKHIKSVNNKDLIEKFARDNNRTIEEVEKLSATGQTKTATRTNWWVKPEENKPKPRARMDTVMQEYYNLATPRGGITLHGSW